MWRPKRPFLNRKNIFSFENSWSVPNSTRGTIVQILLLKQWFPGPLLSLALNLTISLSLTLWLSTVLSLYLFVSLYLYFCQSMLLSLSQTHTHTHTPWPCEVIYFLLFLSQHNGFHRLIVPSCPKGLTANPNNKGLTRPCLFFIIN